MVELTGATRNQLREEQFLASEASSFRERFWRAKRVARRTILASETRYTVYTENIWQAKRAARRTVLASEAQCYFFPQLRGKPLSFYFLKKPNLLGGFFTFKKFQKITLVFFYENTPPTYWGFYLQKIALVFFYKNTPQLAGVFFTLKNNPGIIPPKFFPCGAIAKKNR